MVGRVGLTFDNRLCGVLCVNTRLLLLHNIDLFYMRLNDI